MKMNGFLMRLKLYRLHILVVGFSDGQTNQLCFVNKYLNSLYGGMKIIFTKFPFSFQVKFSTIAIGHSATNKIPTTNSHNVDSTCNHEDSMDSLL